MFFFLNFTEIQLVVVRHPQVFIYTHHEDKSEAVDSCFSALIHVESEFEQLHRTIAFTNMTYNNCGSSTVQPKVHKVCFLRKKISNSSLCSNTCN